MSHAERAGLASTAIHLMAKSSQSYSKTVITNISGAWKIPVAFFLFLTNKNKLIFFQSAVITNNYSLLGITPTLHPEAC